MLKHARGLSLIEVLITLTILLIGLLGLAGLIVQGHRASYEAYQRHQALMLANDIAERMKANQGVLPGGGNPAIAARYAAAAPVDDPLGDPAVSGLWADLQNGSITDCATVACTREQLADYDLALWEGLLLGVTERRAVGDASIGGIQMARGCIEGPLAAPAPENTYRVSVVWQGDVPTAAPISTVCAQALDLYVDRNGAANDATRRAVSIDLTIFNPA